MKKPLAIALSAMLVPVVLAAPGPAYAAAVFVVNSTGDAGDAVPNGVCETSTAGECTLRAALTEANAVSSDAVTINFNIPGSGVRVIAVGSQLPPMNNGTPGITINGFSQPGSQPNTDPLIDNGVRLVEVVGGGPDAYDGFVMLGSFNRLRGLVVRGFKRNVVMSGSASQFNHVLGSIIGLQSNGAMAPNHRQVLGSPCIDIDQGANHNRIGMPGNANRNVISGCYESAINLFQEFTSRNFVQNNILGLDPTGTARRPSDFGVDINWAANANIVGGTGFQERNVISGNIYGGVEISHGAGTVENSVIGNFIGTDPTGNTATAATFTDEVGVRIEGAPNCNSSACELDVSKTTVTDNVIVNTGWGGVLVDKGVHNSTIARNRIGVTLNGTVVGNNMFGIRLAAGVRNMTIGPDNVIAGSGHGIDITPFSMQPAGTTPSPTHHNTITANSIFATGGLGIDLWPFDTVNVAANADSNVNEAVLPPALLMQGSSVRAATCASCTVELFSAPGPGSSGPGVTFLASAVAGADGTATFTMPSAGWAGPLTATTRTPGGSTSEFSVNLEPTTSGASAFVPAGPTRLMDTREGIGVEAGLRAQGSSTDLRVDVPANATAVVLNATITESIDAGYVQLFPTGSGVPGASSNLNVPRPGSTIANLVIVPLGANHSVTFYNHAGGHLVADLFGYFVPANSSSSGRFVALPAPDRVLDTRDPLQVPIDNPGDVRDCVDFATWAEANAWFWTYRRHGDAAGLDDDGDEIPCEGLAGNPGQARVPADLFKLGQRSGYRLPILTNTTPAGGVVPPGATGVVMNVTAVETAEPGFVQVYNDEAIKGKSSNLNYVTNDIAPNLVIAPIGGDGAVTVYTHSAAHVVVDVIGYFTGDNSAASTEGLFVPFTPRRLIDTRELGAPMEVKTQRDVDLAGLSAVTPSAMSAMFMNVTLVDSHDAGYLQVFPTGLSTPGASSSVNVTGPGQIRPNAVITSHNAGQVSVFHHAGGHFIFDAAGYFTTAAT